MPIRTAIAPRRPAEPHQTQPGKQQPDQEYVQQQDDQHGVPRTEPGSLCPPHAPPDLCRAIQLANGDDVYAITMKASSEIQAHARRPTANCKVLAPAIHGCGRGKLGRAERLTRRTDLLRLPVRSRPWRSSSSRRLDYLQGRTNDKPITPLPTGSGSATLPNQELPFEARHRQRGLQRVLPAVPAHAGL